LTEFVFYYSSNPKIHLLAKFPFMRKIETILARIFIGQNHLQTVNLALIKPASSLNSGIQTQVVFRHSKRNFNR